MESFDSRRATKNQGKKIFNPKVHQNFVFRDFLNFYRKQGFSVEKLDKNAAQGPQVHAGRVVDGTEQQFRGPVPSGGHLCMQVFLPRFCQDWHLSTFWDFWQDVELI